MMSLTPEEREVGRENYYEAVGCSRRDFLKQVVGTGAVTGAGLGAMYFGYERMEQNPVRVGVIGTGDEGNVLLGAINPQYVQVVAIADIRPYNIHRAFHGDWASPDATTVRKGLMAVYDWKSEDEAKKHVKIYDAKNGYDALIKDPDVEAVIIALPLHLHADAACKALLAGKHVLTEKLMAHDIAQCKVMGRLAYQKGLLLAVGHQRHYSVLYDNAVNLIRWGVLGQIHHIRAQWHRGNLPGGDSWQQPLPGGETVLGTSEKIDKIANELKKLRAELASESKASNAELLRKKIAQWEKWDADKTVNAESHGYQPIVLRPGLPPRPALEELCRWRLFERTGGGLMAELGSHQLDASGIFISALRKDGKKAHPLTVHAVGGRHMFPLDRHAEDHVYCMYEFAGPEYDPKFDVGYRDKVMNYPDPAKGIEPYAQNPEHKIVVTYSSINGNGFGGYGEIVMGTKGTLVLEREQEVMLYAGSNTTSRVSVKDDGGGVTMSTQASGPPAGPIAKAAEGPVSRGYTEEIEHWAWCIRNPGKGEPRCKPEVALGDAVIALATNAAIRKAQTGEPGFLKFKDEWYDLNSDETPDGSSVKEQTEALVGKV
jgi:predicted dehydrogenase